MQTTIPWTRSHPYENGFFTKETVKRFYLYTPITATFTAYIIEGMYANQRGLVLDLKTVGDDVGRGWDLIDTTSGWNLLFLHRAYGSHT